MAFLKVTVLAATLLALSSALPQYEAPNVPQQSLGGGYGDQGVGPESPASYSFSYDNSDQESGNFYGHAEQREGTSSSGEYRVLLPDGRTQIVKYTVDGDGGYVAQVMYEHSNVQQQSGNDGGYQK